jgi:cytochrome c biogenesis protein CcmG, thiol:disulfide interchange protein DsbE
MYKKIRLFSTLWLLTIFCSYGQQFGFTPDKYLNTSLPFPSQKTIDNQKISLENLKGKPTLINFWFTACKPCIEEIPLLNGLRNQFQDSINFLAITYDPKAQVKRFLKKHPFEFTQITDAKDFTDKLQLKAYPVNVFLDKNGVVTKAEIGVPHILDSNKNLTQSDGKEFEIILRGLLKN